MSQPATDGGRSRITALVRLLTAVWLVGSAFYTLAFPVQAPAALGKPLDFLLPLAGWSFSVGIFLLTGFMTRACGFALLVLGIWETTSIGLSPIPVIVAAVGVYLMLRGSGAWGMDIYVQHMQDRVRNREAARASEQ